MSKGKDLVGATFRALGVSGLVASLGVVASGCLTAAVAGAAAYGGTRMAQKDPRKDLERVDFFMSTICYNNNEKEECVCGGDLYLNKSIGYYLMEGFTGSDSIKEKRRKACKEVVLEGDSKIFSFNSYRNLQRK